MTFGVMGETLWKYVTEKRKVPFPENAVLYLMHKTLVG